ncbi:MAG: DUF2922 domain-containing protein [Sarcina sp.]
MASKTDRVLVMIFKDKEKENISITVKNVKAVNGEQVKGCMDVILGKNVFQSKNASDLVDKVSARLIDTTTTPHEFK